MLPGHHTLTTLRDVVKRTKYEVLHSPALTTLLLLSFLGTNLTLKHVLSLSLDYDKVQHVTCPTMRHTTTWGITLHASRLFTPKHQIFFLIQWEDMTLTIIGALGYLVTADAEGQRRLRQQRRWWRNKMIWPGNENRDVLSQNWFYISVPCFDVLQGYHSVVLVKCCILLRW